MTLWTQTDGYGATAPKVAYLDDAQNTRLERMRVAKMLWKGQHRQAYLIEGRTQFDFPPIKSQKRLITPYVTLNVLKLISTTITDLLLGQEPLIRLDDEVGQDAISALGTRSDLHRVFYDATRQASWAAEAMVEIVRWSGESYIQNVPPYQLFPMGTRNPDGQYTAYRRYATMSVQRPDRTLLLESTYVPGAIERKCYELAGGSRTRYVDLSQWPVWNADNTPLLPREETGLDACSIVWMANELDEDEPTCDYDGLIELQDELNNKQTQIARVIAKHADPKLAVPEAMADADGTIKASSDVFFYRSKDEIPTYITWNAELANAMADRDFTLRALCVAAEMPPVLLGLHQGATPDSARKLRLEATKALARKDRKATFVRPFIRYAVGSAMQMDAAGGRTLVPVSLELVDGLPQDPLDEANELATLRTAGIISMERAVERQLPDPEAAAKEIGRLAEEHRAGTPSVLMNPEPGMQQDVAGSNSDEIAQ